MSKSNPAKLVCCYDNGGESIDNFTVVYKKPETIERGDGTYEKFYSYVGMNSAPFHPQGFCQHGESKTRIDRPTWKHLGKRIKFSDLPEDCQRVIVLEIEGWIEGEGQ